MEINEWFYHDLAGIQNDPRGAGFKQIIIKPAIVGDLAWVKASYDSISGQIVSEWKRDGQNSTLHVVIPPNTTASICIPTMDARSIREGNEPATQSSKIKFVGVDGTYAVYQVGSGEYTLVTARPLNVSH